MALNDKQRRFIAEYMVDLNATQAAIRAGYSKKTALQQGPRLLGNAGVAEELRRLKAEQLAATGLTAERVLKELSRLAFSNVVDTLLLEGKPVTALRDLPEDTQRAIGNVETVKRNLAGGDGHSDEIHKVRMWDKPKALEMLAKHFKLLTEQVEVKGIEGLAARLAASKQRTT